jgi:hypothetical protein
MTGLDGNVNRRGCAGEAASAWPAIGAAVLLALALTAFVSFRWGSDETPRPARAVAPRRPPPKT